MATNYWHDFEEDGIYHVYNRGNNREDIFKAEHNYWYFLNKWKRYLSPYLHLYGYCLMPNHFHLIVRIKAVDKHFIQKAKSEKTRKALCFIEGETNLSTFISYQFKRMFSAYVLAVNRETGRIGSLFQKRFKRVAIQTELQLLHRICYIHHNPIHHGLAVDFNNWKHSSFRHYKYGHNKWVAVQEVLNLLEFTNIDTRWHSFRQYHRLFQMDSAHEAPIFYKEHI